ncbi:class F sortase [Micrococcus luteus]|uniref:class F sortase n=1 Tax=Micrococcus luteus TaxID=1270 RepID=UPI00368255DC
MIRIRPARRGRLVASAAALCLLLTGCAGQTASTPDPAASASAAQAQRSREARAAEAAASRAAASSSAEAVRASAAAEKSAAAEASAKAYRAAASAAAEEAAAEEAARAQAEAEAAAAQAAVAEEAARVAEEERLAQAAVVAEGLDDSPPVSFTIPSIGAGSDLMRLLLRDDGSLAVPPAEPGSPAAWYANSPSPGQRGPAVLLGHVNATDGSAGVFAHLTDLAPGDTIEVEREDGAVAVFAVDRGVTYGKDEFPTDEVYGNTDAPELRLITCDGYNAFTREFEENYIVYATLVDVY